MSYYSGCIKKPYQDAESEPSIIPTQFIIHTFGFKATEDQVWSSFNRLDNKIESHFIMGYDKTIQGQDTHKQADANYHANVRANSCETRDDGNPNLQKWTPWQVKELIRLMRLAHSLEKIPLRICPAWDKSGYGYHTLFGAPSHWTPVAKSCPGKARITQFKAEVWPKFLASYKPPTPISWPALSNGITPVIITIGSSTNRLVVVGGTFLVDINGWDKYKLMGYDKIKAHNIPVNHPFAKLPILKV